MKGDQVITDIMAVDMIELFLPMLTIYERPGDYPENFVIRLFDMDRPTNIVMLFDTLDAAREAVPDVFHPLGRQPGDHPNVVESYV